MILKISEPVQDILENSGVEGRKKKRIARVGNKVFI